mmetsp:Transcript_18552/g.38987  ORF Transcript_18552/g.38987 Transcript_18552/m.38987 type:complete len:282 (+) Transcript_18552:471-1316(+)
MPRESFPSLPPFPPWGCWATLRRRKRRAPRFSSRIPPSSLSLAVAVIAVTVTVIATVTVTVTPMAATATTTTRTPDRRWAFRSRCAIPCAPGSPRAGSFRSPSENSPSPIFAAKRKRSARSEKNACGRPPARRPTTATATTCSWWRKRTARSARPSTTKKPTPTGTRTTRTGTRAWTKTWRATRSCSIFPGNSGTSTRTWIWSSNGSRPRQGPTTATSGTPFEPWSRKHAPGSIEWTWTEWRMAAALTTHRRRRRRLHRSLTPPPPSNCAASVPMSTSTND